VARGAVFCSLLAKSLWDSKNGPLQNEAGRKMGTLAAKILWYLNAPPECLMGTVLGKKHNEINKWLDAF
jgi:hypothetical protein